MSGWSWMWLPEAIANFFAWLSGKTRRDRS